MVLLMCKKRRSRLTGRFIFVVRNAVKFRPVQDDYALKIPDAIMRAAGWRKGTKVNLSVDNRTLTLSNLPTRRTAANQKVRRPPNRQ